MFVMDEKPRRPHGAVICSPARAELVRTEWVTPLAQARGSRVPSSGQSLFSLQHHLAADRPSSLQISKSYGLARTWRKRRPMAGPGKVPDTLKSLSAVKV